MNDATVAQVLRTEMAARITETFSSAQGYYLDKKTSLRETVSALTAERASTPHPGNGESVPAHVSHLIFIMDYLDAWARNVSRVSIDWKTSWTVSKVTDPEWAALVARLAAAETRLQASVAAWDFTDDEQLGGVLSMLVHSAFHLGALRQILDSLD
jgi:hypothetical protein